LVEHNTKSLPENLLPLLRNQKNMMSFNYDANDHIYSKSKSLLYSKSKVQINIHINPFNSDTLWFSTFSGMVPLSEAFNSCGLLLTNKMLLFNP